MYKHKKSNWLKPIMVASAFSVIIGVLVVPEVHAQATTPTPACNASKTSCTVTFPYSGDYYVWAPPADVRTISVAIAGAQGGRSGGNGAKATANFKTLPTGNLYIYVGGQGSSGNAAAGGYNGGGAAGSGHGDEGSGGGATDIRTSTLLADRIAVAGGGGGTGGWIGGSGGSAAGTTASAGGNGQGLGGGAGTSSAGGSGGVSFGSQTTNGSAGASGVGGSGGSANTPGTMVAGGGGGGGGYFGGGGGGADTDPVGVDGGGGGGGSSYMNSTKLNTVAYYSAFQSGNGQASITYNLGPAVTSFTAPVSPSNAATPVFNITFGQSITGLTADDFTISGTANGCYVSTLTGSGATYAATVNGCADGTISLTLKADTVTGNAIGPVKPVSTTSIILDRTVPEINTLTKQASANNLLIYKANFTEPVTGLAADSTDWLVKGDGCSIQSMTGSGSDYVITIANCLDGHLAGLVLNTAAVVDAAGNIGPSLANQTNSTKIDTTAPVVNVFDVTEPGAAGTPTWVFDSEEPVTGMIASNFTFSGTAQSCSMNYSVLRSGLGWQVTLVGCAVGTTQVTLGANTLTDSSGNTGPLVALASNVVTITPDEIVNQTVTPNTPTGTQVDLPKVIDPPTVEKIVPQTQPKKEITHPIQAAPLPVTKELEKQGKKKLVITQSKQQSFLIALGLSAVSLLLASVAAGSQLRSRRRKH
ncbi:MAG: glycine-rich protein [Actinomycetes bacterium]